MPISTLKSGCLFIVVLSFGASYNKGIGNIDKTGNCVKKKSGGAKKIIKFNGFVCSPCKSFLPGLFERINLGVNDFLASKVLYYQVFSVSYLCNLAK